MQDVNLISQTDRVFDILARVISKIIEAKAGQNHQATSSQVQALKYLANHEPCTISTIAEGLGISQPAATMLINRMEKRGLVQRRPSETDRRQLEVSLTSQGHLILSQIERTRLDKLSEILELMSIDERNQLLTAIENFVSATLKKFRECANEVCLRCGDNHDPSCIVSQTRDNAEQKLV